MTDDSKEPFKKPRQEVREEAIEYAILFIGTILLAAPFVVWHNMWYTDNALCNVTQPSPLGTWDNPINISYGTMKMTDIPNRLDGFEVERWRAEIRFPRFIIDDTGAYNIVCWLPDKETRRGETI